MWFVQPKKNYVPEMPWERTAEPEVMSWQVRVRDYNVLVANIAFLVITLLSGSVWFFSAYSFLGEDEYMPAVCVAMFFLMTPVFMGMTHQTSIIVYRLTDKGYEMFSWKPQIDSVKPVMKWTAIVSGVAVLVATFFNPYFILGAVGPAGLGLIALSMGNASSYQELVRGAEHCSASWLDVEEVALWRKRRLIGLRFTFHTSEGVTQNGYRTLYCKKGEKDKRVAFIREKVSEVPYVERKMEVFEGGMAI
ncbi:hypothetical protein FIU88_04435 [Halomonas sp. THAF12]|uniref:hypothetical protein n=1 Tax=Halomonas sp. THAF12 TaxID=2587849 RepID=UPI0012679C63|nr:hypothetical protein [Halomonas sp. THAF12]QFT84221.1 hypothetical protein FIU88_04435 [Halomonas sp. THAF12]